MYDISFTNNRINDISHVVNNYFKILCEISYIFLAYLTYLEYNPIKEVSKVTREDKMQMLIKEKYKSVRKFSNVSGIPNTTLTSMFKKGLGGTSVDTVILICEFLGISIEELNDEDYQVQGLQDIKPRGVKIPVLGKIAAGIPIEAIEDIIEYEEISEEMAGTGDYFCLEIKGDSMAPKIEEKTIVIIRKQSSIESGEIGVVFINNCDATVKTVMKHENGISLISFNPMYPPKFYTCKEVETLPVEIIGKVVESRKKY